MKKLADKLYREGNLSDEELLSLIKSGEDAEYLFSLAREKREAVYGKDVYIRGLIEISCYCRNNCYYCGIRNGNNKAERYRLAPEEIILTAEKGYALGFRTFVLQGGEDAFYTDETVEYIIKAIKKKFPDAAITLSLGERSYESYKRLKEAGADRYLLRHETADKTHYEMLHPGEMSFEKRMKALEDLKELKYQVGCGFMVGSPFQTDEHIVKDLRFIKEFSPHMVGIGPFIPHSATPFKDKPPGTVEKTLYLLAVIRLLLPEVLLPATTALGSLEKDGRERGILAGANVVMPNLTPPDQREKYSLYNNKLSTGCESAEGLSALKDKILKTGYEIVISRGDSKKGKVI